LVRSDNMGRPPSSPWERSMTGARFVRVCGVAVALVLIAAGCGDDSEKTPTAGEAPGTHTAAASVAFSSPKGGTTVSNPVHVAFTAKGFTLEPAGEVHADAGHLHVMVDVACVKVG